MTISVHTDGYSPVLMHQSRELGRWLIVQRAVLGLAALLMLLLAVPGLLRFGGLQMTAVNGHSMGQSVPDQSIVITRSVSADSLRVGDVFVFDAPWLDGRTNTTNVVHRLNVITATPTGLAGYTSGDANAIADPLPASLQGEMPLVKFVVPFAGIFYGMSSTTVFLIAIGLVFLLLVSRRSSSTVGGSTPIQQLIVRTPLTV